MKNSITTSVKINGKNYKVACNKNEVDDLKYSASELDKRVKKISDTAGRKLNDDTLFLFASLELENLLANNQKDGKGCTLKGPNKEKLINSLISTIENFIYKVENMS